MSTRFKTPAQLKSFESFREHWRRTAPELDVDEELEGASGALGRPLEVFAGRRLSNRFAIQPMEGWDATRDGLPSEHTLRRWRRFGGSGAKLLWGGEAFAVREDGRASANQLFYRTPSDAAAGLSQLRASARAGHEEIGEDPDSLVLGLQLTHSGRFSKPDGAPAPRVAQRHPILDPRFGVTSDAQVLTDAELRAIAERYVEVAALAQDAGFDFVDVKCCHGYLLHELLGARRRDGDFGGVPLSERTQLLRTILDGIRARCSGLEIGVRVSIADVFPHSANDESGVGEAHGWREHVAFDYGFGVRRDDPREMDLGEPREFLATLQDCGVRLVNITLGSAYYCPHVVRPAAYPPSDGYLPPEDPLFRVAQHLLSVRACKRAFPEMIFVGSGYSYLQEWLPHVAQHEVAGGHVDLVGIGRMALSYPHMPRDVLAGRALERRLICRTFSDCTTGPRQGMLSGCFPLDSYYKEMDEASEIKRIKAQRRAHD